MSSIPLCLRLCSPLSSRHFSPSSSTRFRLSLFLSPSPRFLDSFVSYFSVTCLLLDLVFWKRLTTRTGRTDSQNDRMKKLGSGENRHLAHSAFLIWTQTNDRDKTTTTTVIARGCLYSRRLYNARCSISTLVTSPQTFLFPTPFFILDF